MGLFSKKKSSGSANSNLAAMLRDERQKASVIVNSIDDAVVLIDAQNVIQDFNPAAATLTGWSQEEAKGIDYRTVIPMVNEAGTHYKEVDHPLYQVFQLKKNRTRQ
jgi:PAS domain S-box-containing protein